ncbi:MAG TPA: hypothetical protein VKH46_08070 [Thermoanaerobaculia bacterium]|nr:hypothetical protein [Thermoanaerobaculia bacterium]
MPIRSRKLGRAVLWAVAVVGVLLALAAAAPGFLLRRGLLLRWVNDKPEKLRLSYSSARAPWPGRVVVEGLEMRGSDPNVQWWFRMERADIRYSLLDLLAKRFHATSVRATGLAFRLRQRLSARHDTAAARAPLPPIPGFGEVPIKGGPPFFPPPEDPRHYWQVQIEGLEAPAREIWIDQYRYAGDAQVAGGFSLWPRKESRVGPARVDFGGGRVWLGRDLAVERLRAQVAGRISSFDPRSVRGSEVYRYVAAEARMAGEITDSRFLNYYLRDSAEPRLSGGRGKIDGHLALRRGDGSLSLTLAVSGVRAVYRKNALAGDAVVRLRMPDWNPADGAGRLRGTSFELADVSSAGGARNWWGRFDVGAGTLRSKSGGLELSGQVAAKCRDARPLYTLFGVALPRWARGIVGLEGLTASAGVVLGPATVEIAGLDARGGKFTIAGDYARRGKAADGAFLVSAGPLSVGVEVSGGKSSLKLVGAKGWFAGRKPKR